MKIAVLYEHPGWNNRLFETLETRGVEVVALDASTNMPDVTDGWDLLFNRMSASAWTRGNEAAMKMTRRFLAAVEATGTPVVNGSRAFGYELSKTRQAELFASAGAAHPRTVPVPGLDAIPPAVSQLAFPVLVKPDSGGSGAGIVALGTVAELEAAMRSGLIELGPSGRGVVQERIAVKDDSVTRIEVLDGEVLYAIRLRLRSDSFNMCPADYCVVDDRRSDEEVVRVELRSDIAEAACRLITGAGADVGSVEYLVDEKDGEERFIDLNVNSNFIADATEVLGFDPWERLVDYLLTRGSVQTKAVPSRTTTPF